LLPLFTKEGNAYGPVGILALGLGLYGILSPRGHRDGSRANPATREGEAGEHDRSAVIDLNERRDTAR
jgi:hypothetical protein